MSHFPSHRQVAYNMGFSISSLFLTSKAAFAANEYGVSPANEGGTGRFSSSPKFPSPELSPIKPKPGSKPRYL